MLCSHFRKVVIALPSKPLSKAYSAIQKAATSARKGDVFAFNFKEKFPEDGWTTLNWANEFKRFEKI